MDLLEVPLRPVPNQELNIVLGGQNCTITLRQIGDYLYLSLWVDDTLIGQNCLILPSVYLLQTKAAAFAGNFLIYDALGPEQRAIPDYGGLGERWQLLYASEADMAELTALAEAAEGSA